MDITDDKIFKIALITSLIGVIGLIFFSPYIEVKEVNIKNINRNMIDEEVSVEGVVESIKSSSKGNTYFLTINDGSGKLPVIVFESTLSELKDSNNPIEIFLNKKVKVNGKITEYNSNIELILSNGNSIKII